MKLSRQTIEESKGAVLIELALALPIFLAVIFGIIWVSQLYQAQTALTAAVGNSMRLGVTRGNELEIGVDIIEAVQTYEESVLSQLLISPNMPNAELFDYGNLEVFNVFNGISTLNQLSAEYPEFVYALIYIKASMRNSLGNSVRYPCDPADSDGAGCLLCTFKNPHGPPDEPYLPPGLSAREMAIECRFRPGGGLTNVVYTLLSLATGVVGGEPPMIIMSRIKVGEFM